MTNELTENSNGIRVVIYGAGAVGGVVGAYLALAGTKVILIGRQSNVNAICEHGLRLITPRGTHILKLPAVITPDRIYFGPNDVVFLCVKAQDTDKALSDLHVVVKDIPVFCFQNGVRNEEIASKYYADVYGVMVYGGGAFINDGEVISRNDPPGQLVLGRYPEGTDELVQSVAAKLRDASYNVLVTSDIMSNKWGKLIVNLTTAIGAITNADWAGDNRISSAVQDEGREILRQAGIRWTSIEAPIPKWPQNAGQPSWNQSNAAKSSTWQSLTRRQGTVETDFFNGEIVRLAEQLGRRAPINETLLRITQEMAANRETPGRYTPTELLRILGLD